MKGAVIVLLLGMLLFGCVQEPLPEPPEDEEPVEPQFCDAVTPCETGDCYKFEDKDKPICFEGDPCSRCASGRCNIAESYPMQVFCIEEEPSDGEFCGWSTYGACSIDADCTMGGCSAQVCQSKREEPVVTTCEYRDCYDAEAYGLSCQCFGGQCQWHGADESPEEPVSTVVPETEPEEHELGLQYCDESQCTSGYSCRLLQKEDRPVCVPAADIYSDCDMCSSGKCYIYSYTPLALKCIAGDS